MTLKMALHFRNIDRAGCGLDDILETFEVAR